MEINTITDIISALGFPIAVCVFLLYKDMKRQEAVTQHMNNISERMLEISETLNQMKGFLSQFK